MVSWFILLKSPEKINLKGTRINSSPAFWLVDCSASKSLANKRTPNMAGVLLRIVEIRLLKNKKDAKFRVLFKITWL